MHLLCIFVFCFSCLDFFAFQFFLCWCVLISPLCLLAFVVEIYIPVHCAIQTKTIENFFAKITSEEFVQTSMIYL
jgi:hypothetical protein